MKYVEKGDTVHIEVEAKLENGEPCFKKEDNNSLELVVGAGKFFPAIENGLLKMKEGETKELILMPEEAFGPHLQELVMEAPKTAFQSDAKIVVGMRIKINAPSGKTYYGTIISILDDTITVDLNHPLAGQKIIFMITIKTITKKTDE